MINRRFLSHYYKCTKLTFDWCHEFCCFLYRITTVLLSTSNVIMIIDFSAHYKRGFETFTSSMNILRKSLVAGASSWDKPKLFASSLTPSHHVFLGCPFCLTLHRCTITFNPINITFTFHKWIQTQQFSELCTVLPFFHSKPSHPPDYLSLKPGFLYPSWRPELTGNRFPLPVNTGRVDGRAFPLAELTGRPHAHLSSIIT